MIATCTTLAAILAAAQGGETITLAKGSDCPTVIIKRHFPKRVSVNADGAVVRGLWVRDGGNLLWKSGRIEAAKGMTGAGAEGYAVQLLRAADVQLEGVLVTNARMGVVIDGGQRITITDSRLWRLRSDGVHAARVDGLTVARNRFSETQPVPGRCAMGESITSSVARRDCRGAWIDGDHPDAIQVRDGVRNLTIAYNNIRGMTQGAAQMAATGAAPLINVVVEHNDVAVDAYHPITMGNCTNCRIRFNTVKRSPGSTKKARIIAGPGVVECGNTVQDAKSVACAP